MAEGRTYQLTIASVGRQLFSGAVRSATFPGSAGEMTVLPGHEALVTTLKQGTVTVIDANGADHTFDIESGVLEITAVQATVLL